MVTLYPQSKVTTLRHKTREKHWYRTQYHSNNTHIDGQQQDGSGFLQKPGFAGKVHVPGQVMSYICCHWISSSWRRSLPRMVGLFIVVTGYRLLKSLRQAVTSRIIRFHMRKVRQKALTWSIYPMGFQVRNSIPQGHVYVVAMVSCSTQTGLFAMLMNWSTLRGLRLISISRVISSKTWARNK